MLSLLFRYFNTIKYLKLSQIFFRIYKKINFLYSAPNFSALAISTNPIKNTLRTNYFHFKFFEKDYTFTFLNTPLSVKYNDTNQLNWFPSQASQLWIYNLHYFDYLFEFNSYDTKINFITDWINNVPYKAKDAWHPYTVSLRICNWIWSLSENQKTVPKNIITSIYQQSHFLSYHLEFDVLGNHLIENCKALIIGGLFLEENKFLNKGLKLLNKQLKEQILEDGGHYERTPMYHIIILADLISIYDALSQFKKNPPWLLNVINKMGNWLQQISDADYFPLFNDSSFDITYSPQKILLYLKEHYGFNFKNNVSGLLKQSGIFYFNNEFTKLWFDCGDLGPDFLLAHAHNDSLNFELSLNNEMIITDSGTYDYESGQSLNWRPFFRSSKSHNVVTIDNEEPNDIWGSFRVANRGRTSILSYNKNSCLASHNSYKSKHIILNRKIDLNCSQSDLLIDDNIHFLKKTKVHFESNFHFHPNVKFKYIQKLKTHQIVVLETNKQTIELIYHEINDIININESYYSTKFMKKVKRVNLTISGVRNNSCNNITEFKGILK
ncbi:hypothetical protein DID75_00095 [Candidatus Marinamargulisbacteria bacterium SCGC AG-410-N11]|nr:hypothetical protein DID75_00095 [Candidatus Marinamargulisbacteria bacterium SCGC AG-410-N11]